MFAFWYSVVYKLFKLFYREPVCISKAMLFQEVPISLIYADIITPGLIRAIQASAMGVSY